MQVTIRPLKSSDASNLQRAALSSVGHVGHVGQWLEGAIAFHDQRKAEDLYAVTAAQLCQINPVKTRRSWPTSVEYLRKA